MDEKSLKTDELSWLNKNGLVHGRIPAGSRCNFLNTCKLKKDTCPNGTNKNIDYSCGAARLLSCIANSK